MVKQEYSIAKIGADAAEDGPNVFEILQHTLSARCRFYPYRPRAKPGWKVLRAVNAVYGRPAGDVGDVGTQMEGRNLAVPPEERDRRQGSMPPTGMK